MKLTACFSLLLFAFSNGAIAEDGIALKSGSKFVRTIKIESGKKDEKPREATRSFTINNVGPIGETGRAAIRGTFEFSYPGTAKGEFFGYYNTSGSQQIQLFAIGVDESPGKFTNPRINGYLKLAQPAIEDGEADDAGEGDENDAAPSESAAKPIVMLSISDAEGNSEENSAEYSIE